MTNSFSLLIALLVTLIVGAAPLRAAQPSAAEQDAAVKISLAGRQCMAKAFCAIESGALPVSGATELNDAMDLFEASLTAPREGSAEVVAPPSPEIAAQLQVVSDIWSEIRPHLAASVAGTPSDLAAIETVARLNNDLLREINKAVGMYQQRPTGHSQPATRPICFSFNNT